LSFHQKQQGLTINIINIPARGTRTMTIWNWRQKTKQRRKLNYSSRNSDSTG